MSLFCLKMGVVVKSKLFTWSLFGVITCLMTPVLIEINSVVRTTIDPDLLKGGSLNMLFLALTSAREEVLSMASVITIESMVILLLIMNRVMKNKHFYRYCILIAVVTSIWLVLFITSQCSSNDFVVSLAEEREELVRNEIREIVASNSLDEEIEFHNFRSTPLCWAIILRDYSTVKELLSKGADVNLKDSSGKYPIMYAYSHYWNKESIQLLLLENKKVTVDWGDQDIITHAMIKNIPSKLFRTLIGHWKVKSLLTKKDKKGTSKLMMAVLLKEYGYCKAILEQDSELIKVKNNDGYSVFSYIDRGDSKVDMITNLLKTQVKKMLKDGSLTIDELKKFK